MIEREHLAQDVLVKRFWNAYAAPHLLENCTFAVLALGDSAKLADELLGQVKTGRMRAAARLMHDFDASHHRMPKPGEFSVLVDGNSIPRCIVLTVQVDIKPMQAVDETFAWAEGGGDRSLSWWMSAHRRYFRRQGTREGFAVDDSTEVVLQRFVVVWPPEYADA